MIHSLDDSVGDVLGRLDQLQLTERTIVIFMSDNGGYGPATSMEPLRGSKGMLYEGGIRVPLIVRWPGVVAGGSVTDVPVIGLDLYPTLLSVAGATLPLRQPIDGTSLLPVLRGERQELDRPLFWHFPAYLEAYRDTVGPWRTTPAAAVRYGRFKLIHFFEDSRDELYDLTSDPGEHIDSVDLNPEKANELRALLDRWWTHVDAFIPTELNPEYAP
jgi:arylsulfatase A-like enzyme